MQRLDARVGDVVEAAIRLHHRRRLTRCGWDRALRGSGAGWSVGAAPVRDGNALDVYIDGGTALPAITAAIRRARSSVHIAGWTISPDFLMDREKDRVTLRDLLADAAARVPVRVLLWSGAPLPVMHPSRAEARGSLRALSRGTRIRGALDSHNRPMHCHHEKLVIVDGTTAFVGGIDLTHSAGDRYDAAPHGEDGNLGWHDAAARVRGPVVADVERHFAMRWLMTTGERLPLSAVPGAAGTTRVQLVRTVPEHTYRALPRGEFSVLDAYIGALRRARTLVHLENQFLWSPEVVAVLRDKLRNPPTPEFRVTVVLPRRPNNGNDDTRGQLGVLADADAEHRLLVGTIGPLRGGRPAVYVHAKIAIVDDSWLTIGSANLNEHSLFNDTEVNLVSDDASVARDTRERLWSEHLAMDCRGRGPLEIIEQLWRPAVRGNGSAGLPLQPLPSISRRSSRLLGPLNGLLVDG